MNTAGNVTFVDVQNTQYLLHSLRQEKSSPVAASVAYRLDQLRASNSGLHFIESGGYSAALRKLSWDSDFFGLDIGKLEFFSSPSRSEITASELESSQNFTNLLAPLSRQLGIEHLSVQVDSGDALSLAVLRRSGFEILDTIACYYLELADFECAQSASVRLAKETDAEQVALISGLCFADVQLNSNRFNCDPLIELNKTREMYELWARKSISKEMADEVLVFEEDGRVLGFITIAMPTECDVAFDLSLASIPLNAVHPNHHGRGVYGALVRAALAYARKQGIMWIDIRTQLPNAGVHRTWQKLGAKLAFCYHTNRLDLKLRSKP